MDCPQCKKGYPLSPIELEQGLVSASCKRCDGALLALVNYRYWIERHSELEQSTVEGDIAENNEDTQLCPKCFRFMLKYQLDVETDNHVDLCASCDEIWLDKGEWNLLKQRNLHTKLPRILTAEWQAKIKRDRLDTYVDGKYAEKIGQDDFSKVKAFKDWLEQHEGRGHIMQYLNYS